MSLTMCRCAGARRRAGAHAGGHAPVPPRHYAGISLPLCVSHSLSLSLSLCVIFLVCLFISLSRLLSLSLYVSLSLYIYIYISLSLPLSLPLADAASLSDIQQVPHHPRPLPIMCIQKSTMCITKATMLLRSCYLFGSCQHHGGGCIVHPTPQALKHKP